MSLENNKQEKQSRQGKEISINSIPKQTEIFGRIIKTKFESEELNIRKLFGEARYGINHIAITNKVYDKEIPEDEIKLTYIHELLHFILNFTGYENIIQDKKEIDIEQFIELLSSGIYEGLFKRAKY